MGSEAEATGVQQPPKKNISMTSILAERRCLEGETVGEMGGAHSEAGQAWS